MEFWTGTSASVEENAREPLGFFLINKCPKSERKFNKNDIQFYVERIVPRTKARPVQLSEMETSAGCALKFTEL